MMYMHFTFVLKIETFDKFFVHGWKVYIYLLNPLNRWPDLLFHYIRLTG